MCAYVYLPCIGIYCYVMLYACIAFRIIRGINIVVHKHIINIYFKQQSCILVKGTVLRSICCLFLIFQLNSMIHTFCMCECIMYHSNSHGYEGSLFVICSVMKYLFLFKWIACTDPRELKSKHTCNKHI